MSIHRRTHFSKSVGMLVGRTLGNGHPTVQSKADQLQGVSEWEKKKNRNALSPNAEEVRRSADDRAPKARGVSMQIGVLGSAVNSPSGNDIWCIFGLKMQCS